MYADPVYVPSFRNSVFPAVHFVASLIHCCGVQGAASEHVVPEPVGDA
jgi:hypothetical protein